MGYFEILKRAFSVTNRNLLALVAQVLLWVAIGAVIGVSAVILFGLAAGSVSGFDISTISPDIIWPVVKSSIKLVFTGAVMLVAVVLLTFILSAFVQAGILGCLIDTARDDIQGFKASSFFSAARHSTFSLLWFYIVWSFMALAVFVIIILTGVAVFYAVLIPMRDAGNNFAAFAVGVPLLVVLILLFIISLLLFYAGGLVSSISLVGERRRALSAIRAALGFINEHFWDTLLLMILVIFVSFAGNMASELVTLPMNMSMRAGGGVVAAVLAIVVIFVMMVFQMYVTLFCMSSFVVFYLDRTTPPSPIIPVARPAVPVTVPPLPRPSVPDADEDKVHSVEEWNPVPLDEDEEPSGEEGR